MRSTRNQPFCWQSKKILRIIKKNFTGIKKSKLLCLYYTLTWIDNDFNGKKINFYTKTISTYSGLSIEWIPQGLKILENLKIITITEIREQNGKFKGKEVFLNEDIKEEKTEETPQKTIPVKTLNGEMGLLEDNIYIQDIYIQEDSIYNNISSIVPNGTNDEKKFNLQENLEKMKTNKNKIIQIIRMYILAKKMKIENAQELQLIIKRNARAGKELKPFSLERIKETMFFLSNTANFKWTMETILKYITENVDDLKMLKMTEKEKENYIINKK